LTNTPERAVYSGRFTPPYGIKIGSADTTQKESVLGSIRCGVTKSQITKRAQIALKRDQQMVPRPCYPEAKSILLRAPFEARFIRWFVMVELVQGVGGVAGPTPHLVAGRPGRPISYKVHAK